MPDPLQTRSTGPVPLLPPLPVPADPGPPRLSADVAIAVLDTLTQATTNQTWVPDTVAAKRDEPVAKKPRGLAPAVKQTLNRWVGGIFARRPEGAPGIPPRVLVAPAPVFDPTTARRYSDGSLAPPDGRPLKGAPAPGQGQVPPPGLERGNSVLRYATNGQTSNFTLQDQGDTNGCGTTSLAMLLTFMSGGRPAFTREQVDAGIRHFDLFSSPGEIAAFARRRGLDAAVTSGSTPDDLKRMIDQGLPVQVLLDVSDEHDGSGLHYELVTGYGMGPDGKPYFELANPWGQREYMAEDAFMTRWSDLGAKGFPLGINRVMIAVKPRGSAATLPADEQSNWFDSGMTSLRVARGLTQVTSGWARRDGATTTAGVIRLLFGGVAAIPALLGHAGRQASTRYMNQGLAQIGQPGGFWPGLGKTVAGGAGVVVTGAVEVVGNVTNRVVEFVADGAYSAVRAIGNWFS